MCAAITKEPYPLHLAVCKGDEKGVKSLLDAKANPLWPNKAGETPLQLAIEHHKPFLDLFTKHAKVNFMQECTRAFSALKPAFETIRKAEVIELFDDVPEEQAHQTALKARLKYYAILDAYLIPFPNLIFSMKNVMGILLNETRMRNLIQAGKWVDISDKNETYFEDIKAHYKLDVDLNEKQVFHLFPLLFIHYWVTHSIRHSMLPEMMHQVLGLDRLILLREQLLYLPSKDFKRIQMVERVGDHFKPYHKLRAEDANSDWFKLWNELETLAETLRSSKEYRDAFDLYLTDLFPDQTVGSHVQ